KIDFPMETDPFDRPELAACLSGKSTEAPVSPAELQNQIRKELDRLKQQDGVTNIEGKYRFVAHGTELTVFRGKNCDPSFSFVLGSGGKDQIFLFPKFEGEGEYPSQFQVFSERQESGRYKAHLGIEKNTGKLAFFGAGDTTPQLLERIPNEPTDP